jgi:cyclic beta-1,2-glucan synthetase
LLHPFRRRTQRSPWDDQEILRAELFSVERLEQHAISLAAAQPVEARRSSHLSLDARLHDNEAVLLAAYRSIADAVDGGHPITPAAEWLLDNYHLVEQQVREIRVDLPPSFYRQLPKLATGPFRGYPRVFGIAWAFVAHTDSRFEPESLRRFLLAYQTVQPLTIGELWAVAITLRIVLTENLRRAAALIVTGRAEREAADAIADQLLGLKGQVAEPDALSRADTPPHYSSSFAVQLVQRLRDQDPRVTPALRWLEERLAAEGLTSDEMVRDQHQRQGASSVTVRNIITSMRLLSDLDWTEFFESVSVVDGVLRAHSGFAWMDFATRDLYRRAIEHLARGSKQSEIAVARAAIAAAEESGDCTAEDARERRRDPGYHLIGAGQLALAARLGYRRPLWGSRESLTVTHGAGDYVAAICILALAFVCLPVVALAGRGIDGGVLALFALLGVIPALDAATALVNRLITRRVGATVLPSLSLVEGIPPSLRTLVVVPMLLSNREAVETQIERLEIHYLASPETELHFALLSDWTDAPTEETAEDLTLLQHAADGIERLNRQHGPAAAGNRFLLLHRRRVWSAGQNTWMGWERKRGKLHELNQLLRGATDTTFVSIGGVSPAVPPDVRYVITLDADTRLPRDAARRLVGKMAHPLNRPRFDLASGHVVEGYALLQPRVAPSLPIGREGSPFQRIFSSSSGIDPYASASSDVYQDLFGEGSYAGKGIYDIDAFEAALAERVPEGTLLSHDLFEGSFARAGLASDIQVVEEFPARYEAAVARQHRWARGDWQLLPWILGRGDAGDGTRGEVALPLISLWKMLDNLRRTLSAPASLVALAAGWLLLPAGMAALWTAGLLLILSLPALMPVLADIIPRRGTVTARSHLRALRQEAALAASQTLLLLVFLAHQAWSMSDAIGRTLFRLVVSHRNLLQWLPAASTRVDTSLAVGSAYRRMSGGIALAVIIGAVVAWFQPAALLLAAPLLLLWLVSPAVAVTISRSPRTAGTPVLAAGDARALRLIARRTWRYFETFVTAGDHWLPPDNFQEDPRPVLAHRTSPTNLGLYLLSVASARDFGWLSTGQAVERLQATLATMCALQRFRGHFFNWYDTQDLRPLDPRYVSSVDSGNLAAHLIALANACRDWSAAPATYATMSAGIGDACALAREAFDRLADDPRTRITRHHLEGALAALTTALVPAADAPHEVAARLRELEPLAATLADVAQTLAVELAEPAGTELLFWAESAQDAIAAWRDDAVPPDALTQIAATSRTLAHDMQFGFLFDQERRLLSIGYRVADGSLDPSCYDLLASEARLASFFAIAKNDIPARHWFRLGRTVLPIGAGAALISWSGSMFEYLMPSLVMRAPGDSLLMQTNSLIVGRQIRYGGDLGVPWGVSESAYNARDLDLTYQYSNFGVPGLGLKRGLGENLVIAPYATALAAMVDPRAAARNYHALAELGARGAYGFYEALDYTRSRVPKDARFAIVRAYMAHHQGMSVVAIANVLSGGRMRERFHAEPAIQATELLLQERPPRDVSVTRPRAQDVKRAPRLNETGPPEVRRLRSAHDATPQVHLLSNGRHAVMLTAAGAGYSRWRDQAVTRWREDGTCEDSGSWFYVRDVESGAVWSTTWQPVGVEPDSYEVTFTEDRAEFIRHDGLIQTTLEVVVSPEDDAEVRRISITNGGNRARDVEVTSYSEIALAPPASDAAHPAFSKLFVQTEYLARIGTILATRRRRSPTEPEVWAAHHVVVEGEILGAPEFETDRARFIGRGHDARTPLAIFDGRRLSGTVGTVLDPVFALRRRVRIAAGTTVRIAYWTCVAPSRQAVLDLVDKHQDANAFARAATLAWTQAQVQLRHLGIDAGEANLFQRLAGHLLFADASLRPHSEVLQLGRGGPAPLWAQGISGDLPIVLLRISSIDDIALARQLLRAHEYWRMKKLPVDLVILNERSASYLQDLQIALETQLRMSQSRPAPTGSEPTRGGVFVLRSDLIAEETRQRLFSVARVVLVAQRGSLADQLDRALAPVALPPPRGSGVVDAELAESPPLPPTLEFFNGLGGFSDEGREYTIVLGPGHVTPTPWINVIANPQFGFQVAAEGGGFTWSVNSRENQLTPWANDPVADRPGEVLYLRDEDGGELWSATAAPLRDPAATYTARHGQGYSRFSHSAHGIAHELLVYVPLADPVKISRLTLRNDSSRRRRLSIAAYVEWVLGPSRAAGAAFIVTEIDPPSGAMLAHNPWNATFGARTAFVDLAGTQTEWTGDRREFLGRQGGLAAPAALLGSGRLSGRVGAGLDPCGALQRRVVLAPGEQVEIVLLLGQAENPATARDLIARYRAADLDAVLDEVVAHWEQTLTVVQVTTPDRSLDLMLNRWALYQTLVCRLWARSALYQASGAYGFRDQLQDGMALAIARPELLRAHLLRAAGRQFPEGDVQHWWLPPTGQGVRTRISDDGIWLAFATAHYVGTTGDVAVLDEPVAFLEGPLLQAGDHDAYFLPGTARETASLFEHCALALQHADRLGTHGLPLIGTGDWNDGMNRVGEDGRGESVWLGWFLYAAYVALAPLATARHEPVRAALWLQRAAALRAALERDGWDGDWYRRGYFDDGTPFGSVTSEECRIDSIAQSWSVLSGAADPARATRAMAAVAQQLLPRDSRLALLFTPPFDHTPLDPGYVKGYPPGIRENGGQYTHAATWSVLAYAQLGDGDRAGELLSWLNPVNRTATRADVQRYKVEPYVVAADVYSTAPHVGRGGWTWYTGSAGWLYRAGLEGLLGFRLQGDRLLLAPCIPAAWPRFQIRFRHGRTSYAITVENPHGMSGGVATAELDGEALQIDPTRIALLDDGLEHRVTLVLGPRG